jgi:hypothetical protein
MRGTKRYAEVYLGNEPLLGRAYRIIYSASHWFASDEQIRADGCEGRFGWSTAVRLDESCRSVPLLVHEPP